MGGTGAMSLLRQDKVRTSPSTLPSSACLGFRRAQAQIIYPTRALGASLNAKQLLVYVHPKGRASIAPPRITIARFPAGEPLVKLVPGVALRVIESAGTRKAATMPMLEIQITVALGNSKKYTGA